jgi:peptidoglycan/LPS O-acetylase OafA/YrhL
MTLLTPIVSAPAKRQSTSARRTDRPSLSTSAPDWVWRGHIPSLDGLRAVAIGLVLLSHAGASPGFPWHDAFLPYKRWLGAAGVSLFFVISGFLITLLLLREQARTATVSLKGFYTRRAFRILPAYLVYLAFVLSLQVAGRASLGKGDWFCALTYTMNFRRSPAWEVGHVWSLSIEEHFYLLWPLLFLRVPHPRLVLFALGAVALMPAARMAVEFLSDDYLHPDWCTFSRLDGIALGCCLAFVAVTPKLRERLMPSRGQATIILLAAGGVLLLNPLLLPGCGRYVEVGFARSVEAFCFATIIWVCVQHGGGVIGRVLNWRPLVLLGTLSYSLYLWQQPFMSWDERAAWYAQWPVNLLLAIGAAVASYRLIEAPFLRLKARFQG